MWRSEGPLNYRLYADRGVTQCTSQFKENK